MLPFAGVHEGEKKNPILEDIVLPMINNMKIEGHSKVNIVG